MNIIYYLFNLLSKCGIDTVFGNIGTTELDIIENIPDKYQVRMCLSEGVIAAAADGYYRSKHIPAIGIYHTGVGIANALSAIHNANCAKSCMFNIIGDVMTKRKYKSPLNTDIHKYLDCIDGEVLYLDSSVTIEAVWKFVNRFYESKGIYTVVIEENFENKRYDYIEEKYQKKLNTKEVVLGNNQQLMDELFKEIQIMSSRDIAFYLSDYYLDIINEEINEVSKKYDLYCSSFPTNIWVGENCPQVNKMPYFASEVINVFSKYERVIAFIREDEVLYSANFVDSSEKEIYSIYDKFTRICVEKKDLEYLFIKLRKHLYKNTIEKRKGLKVPVTTRYNLLNINNCIAHHIEQGMIVVDESNSAGGSYYIFASNCKKHRYISANLGGAIGVGTSLAYGVSITHEKVVCLQSDGSLFYNLGVLWSCVHDGCDLTIIVYQNDQYGILQMEKNRRGKGDNTNIEQLTKIMNPCVDWEAVASGFGTNVAHVESISELEVALKNAFAHCGTDVVVLHI